MEDTKMVQEAAKDLYHSLAEGREVGLIKYKDSKNYLKIGDKIYKIKIMALNNDGDWQFLIDDKGESIQSFAIREASCSDVVEFFD